MRKNTILSEVELSYRELKGLEAHFRELQKESVVRTLKQVPTDTELILKKMWSKITLIDQLKLTWAKPLG